MWARDTRVCTRQCEDGMVNGRTNEARTDTRESRRVHGTCGRGCGDDDVSARRSVNAECDDVCECEWSAVAEDQRMGKRMREQQGLTPTPHANGGIAIERGAHTDPPAKAKQDNPTEFSTTPTPPYPPAPGNQSPPLLPPGACMPDTLESRRIKRGGPRIRGAQRRRVRSTIFRTTPNPNPDRGRPRVPAQRGKVKLPETM